MKNTLIIVLTVVSILSLAAVVAMWNDNRHLSAQIVDKVGGCVDEESHRKLIDTCATLSDVNRRQEVLFTRFREAVYGQEGGEGGRGHGQVWRASGDADERGNPGRRGRGGGP